MLKYLYLVLYEATIYQMGQEIGENVNKTKNEKF